jgi:hypothetical protein
VSTVSSGGSGGLFGGGGGGGVFGGLGSSGIIFITYESLAATGNMFMLF